MGIRKFTISMLLLQLLFLMGCDNTASIPTISGTQSFIYNVGDEKPNFLEGVTANDHHDGDITKNIEVDTSNVDFNNSGTYIIYYNITNSKGKTTKVPAEIIVRERLSMQDYQVTTYITLGNKSKLLEKQDVIETSENSGQENTKITIDTRDKFQEIDGFGAALTESSAYLIANMEKTSRDKLLKDLFSVEEGIGINFIRLPLGASDFALSNYTYNDTVGNVADPELNHFTIERDEQYVIPVLKEAFKYNENILLMGSPWSAPAWMKTNKRLNGGSLDISNHAVFANYLAKFVQSYRSHGLPIYAITPQNEPLHNDSRYPSMYMPSANQKNLIRHIGENFENNNIDTKIIGYDHNWDNTAYPLDLLGSESSSQYLDGIAFHCYAGDVSAQSTVQNAHPDKGIWFTECSGGRWATSFSDNMTWNMENLFIGGVNNYSKAVLFWNIALDPEDGPKNNGCPDCRGVVTVNNNNYVKNEEYYSIGHFSKFVQQGSFRVKTNSTSPHILSTSFINPDKSVTIVLHNKTNVARKTSVQIDGKYFEYEILPRGTYTFKLDPIN